MRRRETMTRHWNPTLERIVRWLEPSPDRVAAAAAVYAPDLMLQLEATPGAVEGGSGRDLEVRHRCPAR
jgi:hypothetical protein